MMHIREGDIVQCDYPVNGIDPSHEFRVVRADHEPLGWVLRIQDLNTGLFMDAAGYFGWRFRYLRRPAQ